MPRRTFLDFDDVSMEYPSRDGPVHALERVTLAFDEGSFVCIVGPSGCGKTTLLQILAGFVGPTGGKVCLDEQPITGPGADRGVVFQQPALFPWMTVFRNAEFGLMVRGVSEVERREKVERYLQLVGPAEVRQPLPH